MSRIDPDNNDVVVWRFDEAAAPFVNSSTSTNAISHAISDLATLSGTVLLQQPSPFAASGDFSCAQFTSTNSGSPRNHISGANNTEVQSPVTFSCWLYIRGYNITGFTQHFFSKQHTTNTWSGVFAQVGMQNRTYTSQPTAFDIFAASATGADIVLTAENTVPLNMWCHVGLVYDGSFKYAYLNGNLVGQTAATGVINYGNHGPWFFGAIPGGSGNPEESACSICDFRIANVARPASYFKSVYNTGAPGGTLVAPYLTYYKLRAYDLSCSPPQPIYWVSSSINTIELDSSLIPCGNLNTLSDVEIVESWSVTV